MRCTIADASSERKRATNLHNSRKSAKKCPLGGILLTEDHHMQPFRAVRAAHDGLLDIGGARRTADQIDASRQIALAVDRTQTIKGFFVRAHHVAGAKEDEMDLRKEG